jgi:hypothetical protein
MHAKLATIAICSLTTITVCSAAAYADWENGEVPEASNAFTVKRHRLRINILGTTAVGITEKTEVSTYLWLDAMLFPNVTLKHRMFDDGRVAVAISGGVGAGLLPYAGASVQTVGAQISYRATPHAVVTIRGNVVAAEGGNATAAGIISPAGPGAAAYAIHGSRFGGTLGAGATYVLDSHNAFVIEGDAAKLRGSREVVTLATVNWTHAWQKIHLSVGLFSMLQLRSRPVEQSTQGMEPMSTEAASKVPMPYANVYWTL